MRWHHRAAAVVALLTAVVLTLGGWTAPAWAANSHPASPRVPLAPNTFIASKVVLPETSIDGPALSSIVGTFEGVSFDKSVIGWTGVDPAHHLSVATSTDGLHFGNTRVLHETSPFRPDVTQMGQPQGGVISIAWTGSDPNHSLNVLFDVYGKNPQKLTLRQDNSFTAPALLQQNNNLLLAWTGTDANHSLNVLPISFSSSELVAGQKRTLSQFSSNAGPHLASRIGTSVVLAWTSRTLQLSIATSTDGGIHFSGVARLPETSAFAPSTTALPDAMFAPDWIGWTGTDAAHHLNLQWTSQFPTFPAGTKTVLNDTALGGPALGFNAGAQIAWTGTDPAHHVNIAKFLLQ